MAYAQWVHMVIQYVAANGPNGSLKIQNAKLAWGKFYQWDNKDKEVKASEVDQLEVAAGGPPTEVASCGRSDAASGTEGSIELWSADGSTKVCNIYWDCPWGKKTNTFIVDDINQAYIVQATGANTNAGAIGTVQIKVAYIPVF